MVRDEWPPRSGDVGLASSSEQRRTKRRSSAVPLDNSEGRVGAGGREHGKGAAAVRPVRWGTRGAEEEQGKGGGREGSRGERLRWGGPYPLPATCSAVVAAGGRPACVQPWRGRQVRGGAGGDGVLGRCWAVAKRQIDFLSFLPISVSLI